MSLAARLSSDVVMYDSEDDGEDGPGESTWSGVTLGGNVLDPYVGEADAMGTARLFDIIRLDMEDRYGWPGVWIGVVSPNWLACICRVSHLQSLLSNDRVSIFVESLTCERICLEMGRIVWLESLESVCNLICGRLDITGPPWRGSASLSSFVPSRVGPGGMVCGEEEWDTFSIIGDCMTAEGDAVSTFAERCLQLRNLGRPLVSSSFGEGAPRHTTALLRLRFVDSFDLVICFDGVEQRS